MTEYIERDAALKIITFTPDGQRIPEVDCDNFPIQVSISDVKKYLRSIPAANVAPVATERK